MGFSTLPTSVRKPCLSFRITRLGLSGVRSDKGADTQYLTPECGVSVWSPALLTVVLAPNEYASSLMKLQHLDLVWPWLNIAEHAKVGIEALQTTKKPQSVRYCGYVFCGTLCGTNFQMSCKPLILLMYWRNGVVHIKP